MPDILYRGQPYVVLREDQSEDSAGCSVCTLAVGKYISSYTFRDFYTRGGEEHSNRGFKRNVVFRVVFRRFRSIENQVAYRT